MTSQDWILLISWAGWVFTYLQWDKQMQALRASLSQAHQIVKEMHDRDEKANLFTQIDHLKRAAKFIPPNGCLGIQRELTVKSGGECFKITIERVRA